MNRSISFPRRQFVRVTCLLVVALWPLSNGKLEAQIEDAWGEEVEGMQCRLVLGRHEAKQGEEISARIEFRGKSGTCTEFAKAPRHISILLYNGRKKIGELYGTHFRFMGPVTPVGEPIDGGLSPSDLRFPLVARDLSPIPPGVYTVVAKVRVDGSADETMWAGALRSQMVTVRVKRGRPRVTTIDVPDLKNWSEGSFPMKGIEVSLDPGMVPFFCCVGFYLEDPIEFGAGGSGWLGDEAKFRWLHLKDQFTSQSYETGTPPTPQTKDHPSHSVSSDPASCPLAAS